VAAAERPIPKLPPLPGSKEYQRIESKKQMELDKALRELVLGAQVVQEPGETAFYFMTRKGKLRRLELTPAQAKQLEDGGLAVVERPEPAQIEHSLVPAAAAEQMFALSKKSVRFLNRTESPIGFMSDDDVKAQQAAEAAGTAPEIADDPEAAEGSAEAAAPAMPTEGSAPEGGSSEPQAQ
jgi:predicted DNA-binding transcriptional regulator YafY